MIGFGQGEFLQERRDYGGKNLSPKEPALGHKRRCTAEHRETFHAGPEALSPPRPTYSPGRKLTQRGLVNLPCLAGHEGPGVFGNLRLAFDY